MRAALAIAAAEVRAHRLALWLGLLVGVVLTSVKAVFFARGAEASTVDVLAIVYAGLVAVSVAATVGAGAVSRDLAERRLAFYLARPLSPLTYWAAKLSAALFLAVAAGALVIFVAFAFGDLSVAELALFASRWRFWLVGLAFVVAAASAAAGAVRARSGLLMLDIVMLPLTWAAMLLAVGSTWSAGTSEIVIPYAIPWLYALATLVLLAAGAAQISLGRLDVARGHAWLSAIAWNGLLACIGGLFLFSRLVASATPAELRLPHGVSLEAPAAGSHVMLEGNSRRWRSRFYPGFFLDERGGFVRMGGLDGVTGFAWSADGRRFAWSKDSLFSGGSVDYEAPGPLRAVPGFQPSLWIMNLDEPGAAPRRLAYKSRALDGVRALSASGRRMLVERRRTKVVLDVETNETIARIEESPSWTDARFLSETVVRALRMGPGQARIVDWDLEGGLTERGAIALQREGGWFASLVPTQDWQRVLRFDAGGLFLHDLDGRLVATLVDGWRAGRSRAAGLLSGGRFGSVEERPDGLRLCVFDSQGRPTGEARFRGRFPLRVGGESAPGLLALGVAPSAGEGPRETLFVDLAGGSVVRREPGVSPALRRWTARGDAALPAGSPNPEPGSLATRLFLSDEGVVLFDQASGARTVLVRRGDELEN